MDVRFSEEQRLLQDSVVRFLARMHDHDQHRRIAAGDAQAAAALWGAFAELGWLGLPLAEPDGGSGAGPVETAIVMEGLGRALVLAPYASTVVQGAALIARLGTAQQRARWLPAIAAGELQVAVVADAAIAADGRRAIGVRAHRAGDGWRLDGAVRGVVDAPAAALWLVPASVGDADGAAGGADGAVVFAVDAMPPRRVYGRVDGRRAADIVFEGVVVPAEARLGTGAEADVRGAVDAVLDASVAAACADAVGALAALVDRTVEHARTRVQFGQPLAANQVLRHRMVDMSLHRDEARAITRRAALLLDAAPEVRARAVSGAKIRVGRAARAVSEGAIQIHGAMGVTDELDIGAYAKRLVAFELSDGTAADHQRRLVALRRRAGGLRPFD